MFHVEHYEFLDSDVWYGVFQVEQSLSTVLLLRGTCWLRCPTWNNETTVFSVINSNSCSTWNILSWRWLVWRIVFLPTGQFCHFVSGKYFVAYIWYFRMIFEWHGICFRCSTWNTNGIWKSNVVTKCSTWSNMKNWILSRGLYCSTWNIEKYIFSEPGKQLFHVEQSEWCVTCDQYH